MPQSPQEVVDREARWSRPVALATFVAIALVIASRIVTGSVDGDGAAEVLRAIDEHSSDVLLSGALQGVGFLLLVAPLVYLFRAAQARSDRVRGQLIGLVVAAPIFLAVAAIVVSVARTEAASEFVAGKATSGDLTVTEAVDECRDERRDDVAAFREDFGGGAQGAAATLKHCTAQKVADDRAENAISDQPLDDVATGFGFGGRIGLAFALFYGCLWAMRTGLLTRFWGSLGMAMGAAALLLLIQFTLIWFLYFAFLLIGWVPGGRPPAWSRGEAVPWPTPGEKAAEELSSSPPGGSAEGTEKGGSG